MLLGLAFRGGMVKVAYILLFKKHTHVFLFLDYLIVPDALYLYIAPKRKLTSLHELTY